MLKLIGRLMFVVFVILLVPGIQALAGDIKGDPRLAKSDDSKIIIGKWIGGEGEGDSWEFLADETFIVFDEGQRAAGKYILWNNNIICDAANDGNIDMVRRYFLSGDNILNFLDEGGNVQQTWKREGAISNNQKMIIGEWKIVEGGKAAWFNLPMIFTADGQWRMGEGDIAFVGTYKFNNDSSLFFEFMEPDGEQDTENAEIESISEKELIFSDFDGGRMKLMRVRN